MIGGVEMLTAAFELFGRQIQSVFRNTDGLIAVTDGVQIPVLDDAYLTLVMQMADEGGRPCSGDLFDQSV